MERNARRSAPRPPQGSAHGGRVDTPPTAATSTNPARRDPHRTRSRRMARVHGGPGRPARRQPALARPHWLARRLGRRSWERKAPGQGISGPPQPLSADCDCSGFDSGEPALDTWLKRSAVKSKASGGARTYVVTPEQVVIGYYALALGSVARTEATGPAQAKRASRAKEIGLGGTFESGDGWQRGAAALTR